MVSTIYLNLVSTILEVLEKAHIRAAQLVADRKFICTVSPNHENKLLQDEVTSSQSLDMLKGSSRIDFKDIRKGRVLSELTEIDFTCTNVHWPFCPLSNQTWSSQMHPWACGWRERKISWEIVQNPTRACCAAELTLS